MSTFLIVDDYHKTPRSLIWQAEVVLQRHGRLFGILKCRFAMDGRGQGEYLTREQLGPWLMKHHPLVAAP